MGASGANFSLTTDRGPSHSNPVRHFPSPRGFLPLTVLLLAGCAAAPPPAAAICPPTVTVPAARAEPAAAGAGAPSVEDGATDGAGEPSRTKKAVKRGPLVSIAVGEHDFLLVDGTQMKSDEELLAYLRRAKGKNPEVGVNLDVDSNLPAGRAMRVIEIIMQDAGIERLEFDFHHGL